MIEHTPTPFSVFGLNQVAFPNGAHADERVDPWDCLVIVDAKNNEVAAVYGSHDDNEMERLADLLAAAPDLLEACKMALYYYNAFRDSSPKGPTELDDIKIIRAAIAKAEGGA